MKIRLDIRIQKPYNYHNIFGGTKWTKANDEGRGDRRETYFFQEKPGRKVP